MAFLRANTDRMIKITLRGMKYLPRAVAFGKLAAPAKGAAIVRHELTG